MKVRKGIKNDIPKIMEAIKAAKEHLKEMGVDQWQSEYPEEIDFIEDMENDVCYVLEDQEFGVVGCMALSFDGDETYDVLKEGEWITDYDYGVIHRIAIAKEFKGKKCANYLLEFSKEKSIDIGIKSIRIDTHKDNKSMLKWIENSGFKKCGITTVEDGSERIVFEMVL